MYTLHNTYTIPRKLIIEVICFSFCRHFADSNCIILLVVSSFPREERQDGEFDIASSFLCLWLLSACVGLCVSATHSPSFLSSTSRIILNFAISLSIFQYWRNRPRRRPTWDMCTACLAPVSNWNNLSCS